MMLTIAGGLALILGVTAIMYAIGFYLERAEHQDTKTALETCRDSLRRARGQADDLQREVWGHPGELARAKREGRQELAEEIRDAKIEAVEVAIKGLNDRLTALDEMHEAGAIDDMAFWARGEELREQIEKLENDKHVARVVAHARSQDCVDGVDRP